ncbi:hypothetical protein V5O48_010277 [Marasmius crinis-equi]|uniref:Sulfotransferase domain-containing protein n=1 Tax=Marasmius crinis-equi TaxID=585013 RepID=A0ABR3F8V1_9AGAR
MDTQPHRIYVLAHTRSASHLFYQLLSQHPSTQATQPRFCGYAYCLGSDNQAPSASAEKWLDAFGVTEEEASEISWQKTLDELQQKVADAESEGKHFLTMDHPYHLITSSSINSLMNLRRETKPAPTITDRKLDLGGIRESATADLAPHSNPTLLPDRFLFSFTPIIVIRHPARAIPSYLRAYRRIAPESSHPDFTVAAAFLPERLVFDAFKSFEESKALAEGRAARVPIVVDGDKLLQDSQGQMKKVCEALGLDEGQISYTWDRPGLEENTKVAEAFFGTINSSTGIFPAEKSAAPLDMQEEVKTWAKEWDISTAQTLEEKVRAAMEDYEYLSQYSL